jgi:hypothetical protein
MRISFVRRRNAGGAVAKNPAAAVLSTAICDRFAMPKAPDAAAAAATVMLAS